MITLAMLAATDEPTLMRVFTWQTKSSLAPRFGDLPIGWYQMHQCAVSRIIRAKAAVLGMLQEHYALCMRTEDFGTRKLYLVPCNTDGRLTGLAPAFLGYATDIYRQADDEVRK